MGREIKENSSEFSKYMNRIINHKNYEGLPIEKKEKGGYKWVVTTNSEIGKKRILWCKKKATEIGLQINPGIYAKVMFWINPEKNKVCQICGKTMSLRYIYPNEPFLKKINTNFNSNFDNCTSIFDIWEELLKKGYKENVLIKFIEDEFRISLLKNDPPHILKIKILGFIEALCRLSGVKKMGPGAMSNFPDRFDGFHSYNRCCRSKKDKGRFKDNLKRYLQDRRAFEHWSDGNFRAANQFMKNEMFNNASADHVGPISLGFIHESCYLKKMSKNDNSSKRDRLEIADIEKIIEIEKRTKISPITWFSKKIWEHLKSKFNEGNLTEENLKKYREVLKQNIFNFMGFLWLILEETGEKGKEYLKEIFLKPKFNDFLYDYEFNHLGEIIKRNLRNKTERGKGENERFTQIAFKSIENFHKKINRKISPIFIEEEEKIIKTISEKIKKNDCKRNVKQAIYKLFEKIQERLLKDTY